MRNQKTFENVSVVMISRNEEKAVAKVISDLKKDAPGAEILLVDSSTDATPKIAEQLGAKVIRQIPPKGYGPAMEKALLDPKRDIIVTLDCDDTYPTNVIPLLIKKINEGYDIVGTSRISKGKPANMPTLNYLSNKFVNLVASVVFLRKIHDGHTGMRAYKRNVLHEIKWWMSAKSIPGLPQIKFGTKGNALPVELLLKPISLGYRCTEVPIVYKQRAGNTKLEKLNSLLWSFIRIITSRFSNKSFAFGFFLFLLLTIFTVNNFLKYNPFWGYDAQAHMEYIIHFISKFTLSSKNYTAQTYYAASNPPLYYFLMSFIYSFFHQIKLIQFFSILFYSLEIIMLLITLNLIYKNRFLNYSITFFFALLPVTLTYAYMIFNYSLAFFLFITVLFLIILTTKNKQLNYKFVILIAILTNLGVLTALTNLAIFLIVIVFIFFYPYKKLMTRIKYILVTLLITLAILVPYYIYRVDKLQCFFCTFNRAQTTLPIDKVYPLAFFTRLDFTELDEPYFPQHLDTSSSLWIQLHRSLFVDYFGYLIDSRLNHDTNDKTGLIKSGWNYISQRKIIKEKVLAFLGIPIAFSFVITLLLSLKDAFLFLFKNRKDLFLQFLVVISSGAIFAQFIIYILKYPDWVNIHAGYLFPMIFVILISLPKYFENRYLAPIIFYNFILYSFMSYYTYFFKI